MSNISRVINGWCHGSRSVVYWLELRRPHGWQKCKQTAENDTFYPNRCHRSLLIQFSLTISFPKNQSTIECICVNQYGSNILKFGLVCTCWNGSSLAHFEIWIVLFLSCHSLCSTFFKGKPILNHGFLKPCL